MSDGTVQETERASKRYWGWLERRFKGDEPDFTAAQLAAAMLGLAGVILVLTAGLQSDQLAAIKIIVGTFTPSLVLGDAHIRHGRATAKREGALVREGRLEP
jgi:hypothetical protein